MLITSTACSMEADIKGGIAAGFADITNVTGGFGGARSQTGEVVERGWLELELPVEHDAEGANSYPALVAGANR